MLELFKWIIYVNNIFFSLGKVPPTVRASELVFSPIGHSVLLQCFVEVFPKPLNGWYRNNGK